MIGNRNTEKLLPSWLFLPEYQKLVRVSIIAAVLLISFLIAVMPDVRLGIGFLGLMIAAVGAILLLRRLPLGLIVIIIAAMIAPTPDVSGSSGYLVPPIILVILLLGLWLINMLAHYRRIKFVRSRTIFPALALVIITIIAFLNGRILYTSFAHIAPLQAQIGGVVVFLVSMGVFLLTANLIEDVVWLRRMVWIFIAMGGFYILGRITPVTERFIRPIFQYGADASMFWIWLVAMTSSQALFNSQLTRRQRLALLGVLAGTIFVSVVQVYSWKSGWLPALVALFAVIWIGVPRIRMVGIGLVTLVAALYFLGSASQLFTGGEDYSILTRSAAWMVVLEIARINPILGLGLSNYFWYTPLFPILGYRGIHFSSHNNYIDILAQMGIIGLGIFLWLAYEIGRLGWELLKIVPLGFPRAYVIGVLGGLVGMLFSGMLGDWFLPFVYNVGLHGMRASLLGWLFLGGLVALEEIYRNKPAQAQGG